MSRSLLNLNVAYRTDIGLRRAVNEDNVVSYVPQDPQEMARKGALFVVADGMGGHAHGAEASELAVNGIRDVYYQDSSEDIAESLQRAVEHVNVAIYDRSEAHVQQLPEAERDQKSAGMGATIVATVLKDDRVYVANAGDSLAYILRADQVIQITQDHSYIADQARKNNLTLEEAKVQYAEQRNIVTRCLGVHPEVEVYVASEIVSDGDILVLCTDGLTNLIDETELRSIVQHYEPEESAQRLIARANELGGPDNITALVVRVSLTSN